MTAILLAAVVITLAALLLHSRRAVRDTTRSADSLQKELNARIVAVERQNAAFQHIVNDLDDGLLAVDSARRVVFANPRFTEMFDLSGDLVGSSLGEVIRAPAVYSAFDAAIAGRESQERFSFRIGVVERKIDIRAIPLKSDDISAVGLFIDVTRLERL